MVTPREAHYGGEMTRYVIDAATLLHLVDDQLTVDAEHQLVAPNSIRSQALQLLWNDVRRGERTDTGARASHEAMTELKMRLLGDRVSRWTAWQLARELDLESLRPAEYLAVTRLPADALVTVDRGLAAIAEGVVPLASVEAMLGNGDDPS
jgi:predicted nucleic acid-binding protein